jgi:hypothetical protein
MGGVASAILGPPKEIWTPEERAQNEAALLLQRAAADFVVKYLFVDVPAKVNKLSMDPASPLWIQIDQSKVQELNDLVAQQASSGGGRYMAVDDRIFNSVPTGVMVDKLGAIQVIFEKESTGKLVYDLSVKDAQIAEGRVAGPPAPKPPAVSEVGKRGMRLDWTFPAPPGVVQAAEIVHATVPKDYRGSSSSKSAMDVLTWKVLAKKTWEFLHFQDEVMEDMLPGTTHMFRMRYRDIRGWSDFSAATEPVTTLPDVPATPKSMKCGGCFPDAVSLQWRVPASNGSPITAFVVHGRSVGDDFVEVYRGLTTSYLAVGLHPEFAYSFTLTAVNAVGDSLPSQMLSLQLPPRKTERGMTFLDDELKRVADKTKEAWREFWDQKTGKSFYFNSITGQRTLDRPECMGAMFDFTSPENLEGEREKKDETGESAPSSPSKANAHGRHQRHGRHSHSSAGGGGGEASSPASSSKVGTESDEIFLVDPVKAKEMAFRKKRFRLLQAIHKDKKQRGSISSPVTRHNSTSPGLVTAVAIAGGASGTAAGAGPRSPGVTVLQNALEVSIRRDRLLSDGYHQLMSASMDALMKRTRISFVGEEGIDSGGPSKEFFLLLSAQAGVFGSTKRTFLRTADEGGLFLNGPIPPPKPSGADDVGLESMSTTTPKPRGKSPPDMNDLQVSIFDFASFLGRLLGKALFERQLVDLPMAHALLDAMLGHQKELHADEMDDEDDNDDEKVVDSFSSSPSKAPNTTSINESAKSAQMAKSGKYMNEMYRLSRLDVQLHKSLSWILDNDIDDIIVQTFSVTSLIYPPGGGPPKPKDFPLCKNGLTKDVTDENKEEYVRLRAEYETRYAAEKTLRPFTDAFHELVPLHALKEAKITPIELDIMLNGKIDIDVEEVRAYTIFQGNLSCDHIQVVWLWDILRLWDMKQRRAFLRFVTGTSRVALDGYDPPFNLTEGSDMMVGSLPRAHTCFNQLVLPKYESREQMSERMWFAIENTDGFAMA